MGLYMLRLMGILLGALLCLPLSSLGSSQIAQPAQVEQAGIPVVAINELPAEARDTLHAIKQGGPFAFPRDGAVFNNFEQDLPIRQRGYYREYTVMTPGVNNRGVRRIVSGESGEYFYTADHYQTFKRILE